MFFYIVCQSRSYGIKLFFFSKGIFFLSGPPWKEQRRFTLRYLRDFGFGRRFSTFEVEINDELLILIDMLKNGSRYPHERVCFDEFLGYQIVWHLFLVWFLKEIIKNGKALCPYIFSINPVNLLLHIMRSERYPRSEFGKLLRLT